MNKDLYEAELFKRDFQHDNLQKALDLVAQYIKFSQLKLVGGMAIDFALRAKGSSLYPDNTLPDYDVISANFHIDAYTLGERLAAEGLDGISVIRGLHVSTMRVRVNFVAVFDCTYVPEEIYARIPTISYEGFNIVAPAYQMIDQYRAMSFPFSNAPRETVLQRWKKDMQRNDMLNAYYEVKPKTLGLEKTFTRSDAGVKNYLVPLSLFAGNCLGGYPALAYWLHFAKDRDFDKSFYVSNFVIEKNTLDIDLPNELLMTIISDKPDDLASMLMGNSHNITRYNSILDKVPERIKILNYEIINNYGSLTSAYKVPDKDFHVANLQSVLCYFLTFGLLYNNDLATECYCLARKLLQWGAANNVKELCPAVSVYGCCNLSESYVLSKKDLSEILQGQERSTKKQTPKDAFPSVGKPINPKFYEFDPAASHVYQIDGLPIGITETSSVNPSSNVSNSNASSV